MEFGNKIKKERIVTTIQYLYNILVESKCFSEYWCMFWLEGCLHLATKYFQYWKFVPDIYLYRLFVSKPGFRAVLNSLWNNYKSFCGRMGQIAILYYIAEFWQFRSSIVPDCTRLHLSYRNIHEFIKLLRHHYLSLVSADPLQVHGKQKECQKTMKHRKTAKMEE